MVGVLCVPGRPHGTHSAPYDYFFGASGAGISSESGTSPRIILLAAPTSFK